MAVVTLAIIGARDYPLDVDEALYSLRSHAIAFGAQLGPIAFVSALMQGGRDAPLIPFLAVPFVHLSRWAPRLFVALFLVPLGVASRELYRSVIPERAASQLALITLCVPGILAYAGMYHFGLPLTAVLTLAMMAQLRCARLTSRRWSVAWGALLGASMITRTLGVALVPGLVAALLFTLLRGRPSSREQLINAGAAAVTTLVVAGPFYLLNGGTVLHYLINFGYGQNSPLYVSASYADLGFWLRQFDHLTRQVLFAPLSALSAISLALGVWYVARVRRFPSTDAVMLAAIVVVWDLGVLTTQKNDGTGFLLPLVVPLAMLCAAAVRPFGSISIVLLALATMASIVNLAAKVAPASVYSPAAAGIPIVDGRSPGEMEFAQAAGDYGPGVDGAAARGRDWWALNCDAAALARRGGVLLGFSDADFNANSVRLCLFYGPQSSEGSGVLMELQTCEDAVCYASELAQVRWMITAATPAPYVYVDQSLLTSVARANGWNQVGWLPIGDGRVAAIWVAPRS